MANAVKVLIDEYGSCFRFWLGPDLNIVVSDPDDVKILLSSPKMSVKGPQYKYMADILGDGILSGSGSVWKKHRKIVSPNYSKRAIENYENVFNIEVDELIAQCRKRRQGDKFDVYKHFVQTTTYCVCQTLLGISKVQAMNLPYLQTLIDDSHDMYDIVFDRMTKWWLQIDPVFWLSSSYKQQKNFKTKLDIFCGRIINYAKEKLKMIEETKKQDLIKNGQDTLSSTELSVIDRLILSNELDHYELLNETFTVFTSSQEASAKISSALILMLAYHPACQELLYKEIVDIIGDTDRYITEDDIKKMTYLDMVFKEVVRLFPIGSMIQRTVTEDINISKATLVSGCSFLVPLFHLLRHPKYWEKPNAFYPEHFSPENMKRRHPNSYIPFSLGPMDCLGRYFGMTLVKIISIKFLREFRVSALNKYEDMKLNIAISASSLDGYKVILNKRVL